MKQKNIILIFFLIILDQFTKIFFYEKTIIITDFFYLTYTENTGIAFSLLQNNNFILMILTTIILIGIIYLYKKEEKNRIGLSFIIAGATGNLIDRIIHGFVIDFIRIGPWPIFNLADAFNIIGIIILIYQIYKK